VRYDPPTRWRVEDARLGRPRGEAKRTGDRRSGADSLARKHLKPALLTSRQATNVDQELGARQLRGEGSPAAPTITAIANEVVQAPITLIRLPCQAKAVLSLISLHRYDLDLGRVVRNVHDQEFLALAAILTIAGEDDASSSLVEGNLLEEANRGTIKVFVRIREPDTFRVEYAVMAIAQLDAIGGPFTCLKDREGLIVEARANVDTTVAVDHEAEKEVLRSKSGPFLESIGAVYRL
jgi:hypothetical protein